jgi:hypothetical protein
MCNGGGKFLVTFNRAWYLSRVDGIVRLHTSILGKCCVRQCVVMITCMYGSVRGMRESGKLAAAGIQEVLLLRSTSLLRKYTSFVDAAWTSLFHRHFVLSSVDEYWLAKQAMEAHSSQYLWFRRAYVLLSRYMFANSFTRLQIHRSNSNSTWGIAFLLLSLAPFSHSLRLYICFISLWCIMYVSLCQKRKSIVHT